MQGSLEEKMKVLYLLLIELFEFSIAKGSVTALKSQSRASNVCEDHSLGDLVPNPTDCSKFYYCLENGSGAEADCPHGLLFNKESNLCDKAGNVKCAVEPRPDYSETDEVRRYCATKAIQQNGRIEYLGSTSSCRHYYTCYYGQAIRHQCHGNLHWNRNMKKCDFAENAHCQVASNSSASSNKHNAYLIHCPAHGQHIFPYMRRCNFFVYCVKGLAILQQCPFYHHFDVESKTCKSRKVAHCVTEFLT